MWGSTVAFITKHYELLQCFQYDFFSSFFGVCFVIFKKKLSVDFFLILI
jgi:hypothetical protein